MTTKKKSNDSASKQNKVYHIDVRFTEEGFKLVVRNAAKCRMPKSLYAHEPAQVGNDRGTGGCPEGVSAARAELVGIRNALQGLTQEDPCRHREDEPVDGTPAPMGMWDEMVLHMNRFKHKFARKPIKSPYASRSPIH